MRWVVPRKVPSIDHVRGRCWSPRVRGCACREQSGVGRKLSSQQLPVSDSKWHLYFASLSHDVVMGGWKGVLPPEEMLLFSLNAFVSWLALSGLFWFREISESEEGCAGGRQSTPSPNRCPVHSGSWPRLDYLFPVSSMVGVASLDFRFPVSRKRPWRMLAKTKKGS